MEDLKKFYPLFQAIIAFSSFLFVLGFVVVMLLNPIKENQVRLENRMEGLEKGQMEIKIDIMKIKTDMAEIKLLLKPKNQLTSSVPHPALKFTEEPLKNSVPSAKAGLLSKEPLKNSVPPVKARLSSKEPLKNSVPPEKTELPPEK